MKTPTTKTSGIFTSDPLGSVAISLVSATVLELRYEQYGSRATAMRGFERASELLREHPAVNAVVFDVLQHAGHDPGNTALGLRWISEFRDQIRRVAMVTRRHSMATLANVGKVMAPWLEVRVFPTTEEALAWCEQPPTRTASSQTGAHPAGGRRNNVA